jgi:cell wall-associated NlpC family hydrolase
MILRKYLYILACLCFLFVVSANAQERARVVENELTERQTSPPQITSQTSSQPKQNPNRPVLTNQLVVRPEQNSQSLVRKTGSSQPTNPLPGATAANKVASKYIYSAMISSGMMQSIKSKLGIPYRYNSMGPNTYDCSGFVWSVFQDAGIYFERSSARSYWNEFEPVGDDEKYKFGTLVFFNRLGHIGIVVDEKGFYHASTSKGITYSPFEGYWEKRIDGFRRIPLNINNF